MPSREELIEAIRGMNIVAPLRHIFGDSGREIVDCVEVLLNQEAEVAVDALLAQWPHIAGPERVESVENGGKNGT